MPLGSEWVEAYQHFDAKRLAALEIPDMQTVDRFGALHVPSGRNENEPLWTDAFNMGPSATEVPTVTVERAFSFFGPMSLWCRCVGDFQKASCLSMESASLHIHRLTPMS